MIISQLYEILSPFEPKIICGKNGLQHQVDSVEVMEVTNVEEWISPKTVVLSNFFALKDDIEGQKALIIKLSKSKSSGLILKIGRFIENLSPEVIQVAEERAFPIITIQGHISYMEILNPIYKHLDQDDSIVTYLSEETNQIQHILNIIERAAPLTPYIEDTEGHLLFKSHGMINDSWRDNNHFYSSPAKKNYKDELSEILLFLNYTDRQSFYSEKLQRVLIPFKLDEEIIGFLHIPHHSKNDKRMNKFITDNDLFLQLYHAVITEIIKLQQKEMKEKNHQPKWENTYLLMMDIPEFDSINNKKFSQYYFTKIQINEFFNNMINFHELSIFYENNHVYILIENINQEQLIKAIENIKRKLSKTIFFNSRIIVSSTIGSRNHFTQQKSFLPKILNAGKLLSVSSPVYTADQLGIYSILMKLNDEESINYINNIISPIEKKDPLLMKTLEVYLYENLNASKTADVLFIDRRTVTYRLNKIKELFNIDFNNHEDIFKLNLCLRLRKIQ